MLLTLGLGTLHLCGRAHLRPHSWIIMIQRKYSKQSLELAGLWLRSTRANPSLRPFGPAPSVGHRAYGVLMIRANAYRRRCRDCWHSEEYRLPPLKKEILYLDQFVVSEIMKLRTVDAKGHQAVAAEPFWAELAALLVKLGRLQLICCPVRRSSEQSLLHRSIKRSTDPTSRSPEEFHFIKQ